MKLCSLMRQLIVLHRRHHVLPSDDLGYSFPRFPAKLTETGGNM